MYEIYISNEAEKYYKKQANDTKKRINIGIEVMFIKMVHHNSEYLISF